MGKINILVDGGSGTGKSAVADELVKRGFSAVNSDWLCYNGDPETGESVDERTHETWIWDNKRLVQLLDNQDAVTFICGGARNRDQHIDRFDYVFELIIDEETLKHRIATRADGNDWGKKPEELEIILRIHKNDPDRPKGATEIDATQPLDDVVDQILSAAQLSTKMSQDELTPNWSDGDWEIAVLLVRDGDEYWVYRDESYLAAGGSSDSWTDLGMETLLTSATLPKNPNILLTALAAGSSDDLTPYTPLMLLRNALKIQGLMISMPRLVKTIDLYIKNGVTWHRNVYVADVVTSSLAKSDKTQVKYPEHVKTIDRDEMGALLNARLKNNTQYAELYQAAASYLHDSRKNDEI